MVLYRISIGNCKTVNNCEVNKRINIEQATRPVCTCLIAFGGPAAVGGPAAAAPHATRLGRARGPHTSSRRRVRHHCATLFGGFMEVGLSFGYSLW